MPAGTLDDRYLRWLYGLVADAKLRRGSQTYWGLLRQLYKTEFTWFVPNDTNRAMDGLFLREEWAQEHGHETEHEWMALGCSVLEMLIALARRGEFQNGESVNHWFWCFIENLGFSEFHDASRYDKRFVVDKLNVVLNRAYDADGNGGLFPMRNGADNDQRKVEIWYQFCEYILQDL